MGSFEGPTKAQREGLTRRQALCRAGGSLICGMLAGIGLGGGRSAASLQQAVSLRAVLQQFSPGCNPSHGIRIMLPDDRPVISLLDVIRRFYRG